jgi:hypothetical protein
VDGGDFTIWRKSEGTTTALPNDPIGGTIGEAHYEQWRANFGRSAAAGGSGPGGAIPEPATLGTLLVGAIATAILAPRHARPGRTRRAA